MLKKLKVGGWKVESSFRFSSTDQLAGKAVGVCLNDIDAQAIFTQISHSIFFKIFIKSLDEQHFPRFIESYAAGDFVIMILSDFSSGKKIENDLFGKYSIRLYKIIDQTFVVVIIPMQKTDKPAKINDFSTLL